MMNVELISHSPRLKLEVRHLRLLLAIAGTGSVTRAAPSLNLTQSALSHQLLGLERDLNVRLFERAGKKMRPTVAGTRLIEAAERIIPELSNAERDVQAACRDDRISLRVAASCPISCNWLTNHLAVYGSLRPHISVELFYLPPREEMKALEGGTADLIVTSHVNDDQRVVRQPLFSQEVIAVMSEDHDLARGRSEADGIRWRDLAGETIFIHDLPASDEAQILKAVRADFVHAGADMPFRSGRVSRVQMTEGIVELARARQGIGIVARPFDMTPYQREGVVTRVLRPRHYRSFDAVWSARNFRDLPLDDLSAFLVDAARVADTCDRIPVTA